MSHRGIGIFSILFYYLTVFILSAGPIANMFQPQLNGMIFSMLGSPRVTFFPLYGVC